MERNGGCRLLGAWRIGGPPSSGRPQALGTLFTALECSEVRGTSMGEAPSCPWGDLEGPQGAPLL